MSTTSTFITVPEIQKVLTVSESKAYRIVRTLNEELKKKGFLRHIVDAFSMWCVLHCDYKARR